MSDLSREQEQDFFVVGADELQSLRAKADAAEGLEKRIGEMIERYDHSAEDCEGMCVVERQQVVADLHALRAQEAE